MIDTLSDVLRAVRLTGAVYFAIDASAPWVAETPASSRLAPYIMPGVEHVIGYHVVTSGACFAGPTGEAAVRLEAGDIIVFPQGDEHVVSSAPGMRGGPRPEDFSTSQKGLPVTVSIQGGGEHAKVICGYLGCDARPFNPLLASLPRVIQVRRTGERGAALRQLVDLALVESSSPRSGSDIVLSRLSELLFVEIVRHYADALPAEHAGWFSGLRDPGVGRALQRLHQRPAQAWSLDELAKEAGVSRTVLAERFTHFIGVPPIQYLAQWRIQLAASLLRTSTSSLAEISQKVGYGSEAALSKAFKRLVGVAPALYRSGSTAREPAKAAH